MTKTKPNINSGLSWIGTILQYMNTYGFFNIIKSCILLILIAVTLRICYHPEFLFEKYTKYIENRHLVSQSTRLQNDDKIQTLLPSILGETKADRVWIIQYHNGTSDWTFGSMRFELCAPNIVSIKRHYDNFHLSWVTLPSYLRANRKYIGTVEDLKEIDCTLHDQLMKRNVKYVAVIEIASENGAAGVLGCTYEKEPDIPAQEIRTILNRYSGKLEELLPPQIKYNE